MELLEKTGALAKKSNSHNMLIPSIKYYMIVSSTAAY